MDRHQFLALAVSSLMLHGCSATLPCGGAAFVLTGNEAEPVLGCNAMGGLAEAAVFASRFEVLAVAGDPDLVLVRRKPPPIGVVATEPPGEMILATQDGEVRWRLGGAQIRDPLTTASSYSISPDGLVLAAGSLSGTAGRFIGLLVLDSQDRQWRRIRGLPDERYGDMVAGWLDARHIVFDDKLSVVVKTVPDGKEKNVAAGRLVSISPNRRWIAVKTAGKVRILSTQSFREQCADLMPGRALPHAVWSPNSRYVWVSTDNQATALVPNLAKLIDVTACQVIGTRLVAAGSGVSRWQWLNKGTASLQ